MRNALLVAMVLVATLAAEISRAQTCSVQLLQRVEGSNLIVDIEIGDASTAFVLGTSSFLFNYNASALANPAKIDANDGPWDNTTDKDYNEILLSSGAGFAGLTVEFLGDADLGNFNGATVPLTESWRRVGTVTLNITNPFQTSALTWRNIGSNTQVYKLRTPGSDTTTMVNITPTATFFTPANLPLPVELMSFVATTLTDPYRVQLTWKTATERENYGFEVQKSETDKNHYQTIPNSFQPGHGTTNVPQSYSFVDETAVPGVWYYRLKQIDLSGKVNYYDGVLPEASGTTGIEERDLPTAYGMDQNYPNPFNPTTTVSFALPEAGRVSLEVYNLLGQRVATVLEGQLEAGYHNARFDAASLPSGVYFYRLTVRSTSFLKKMVLLK